MEEAKDPVSRVKLRAEKIRKQLQNFEEWVLELEGRRSTIFLFSFKSFKLEELLGSAAMEEVSSASEVLFLYVDLLLDMGSLGDRQVAEIRQIAGEARREFDEKAISLLKKLASSRSREAARSRKLPELLKKHGG